MELYLIRHGLAVDQSPELKDGDRALTKAGISKTDRVMRRMLGCGLEFELIGTSPLVRAKQTAEIAVTVGLSSRLQVLPWLAPGGSLEAAMAWLSEWRRDRSEPPEPNLPASASWARRANHVAWVGHEPDLSQWAEQLLWNAAKGTIVLKKAGIIGLALPESGSPVGRSQLFWLTAPGQFL